MTAKEQLKAKDEKIERLEKKNRELSDENAALKRDLEWLRKKVFGRTSEKNLPLDPDQLSLFDEGKGTSVEENAERAKDVQKAEEEITNAIRPEARPARKPLDTSSLPVEEHHIYPDGTTDAEGNLKDEYEEIATEETSRLERIPAKVFVVRIIRHKVIRKSDKAKNPEDRQILIAPLPIAPVFKCIAGASVLTDLIIGKFMYHLPFYRQIQIYRECGISISDSTIGGWFEAAIEKLKPLYDLLKQKILSSEYIQIDESVIPVLDDKKHKARRGYEWVVRDGITGDVIFYYDGGKRTARIAEELIGSYKGLVQSDGYIVYDRFEKKEKITLIGCWAHARRKFVEALKENRALATQAVNYIAKLYKVESETDEAGMSADERRERRRKESYPVILEFEKWMKETYKKVLPQSRLGKAIEYAFPILPRLSRYVNDGRVNIDNNLIENAIRPLAIGRKNYLFCGNDAAAYRAAIAYSLIGTCKAAGVDPRMWMEDVLRKIPYYERDGKDKTELLPGNWAKQVPNSPQKPQ